MGVLVCLQEKFCEIPEGDDYVVYWFSDDQADLAGETGSGGKMRRA
jgi:hypothetical protein